MSSNRSFSWNSALRSLHADRIPAVAARAHRAQVHADQIEAIRAKAGISRGMFVEGSFNRRAIMAYAVANARCERLNHPSRTWASCMSESLELAWATAHAARRAAAH